LGGVHLQTCFRKTRASGKTRSLETDQIIAQLIAPRKRMLAARWRGQELGLSEEELAFYDALGACGSR
jgi:type I restriction enzyme R subunit